MVCTKNTTRKQHLGLPKARFSTVPTGRSERDLHYKAQLQLPSDDADWTSLTPMLTGTKSSEVGRAVDRINVEQANSPPQTIDEFCALVQDLWAHPPTPPSQGSSHASGLQAASHDYTTNSHLFMETVAETVHPPLILAKTATAIPARGVPHSPL